MKFKFSCQCYLFSISQIASSASCRLENTPEQSFKPPVVFMTGEIRTCLFNCGYLPSTIQYTRLKALYNQLVLRTSTQITSVLSDILVRNTKYLY